MEPVIVEKGMMRVAGLQKTGHPQDIVAKITEIWKEFLQYEAQVKPSSIDGAYYGVWFGGPTDDVAYLVGMAVEGSFSLPEGLIERVIPAAKFAVFSCTIGTFGPTSDFAYTQWLPAAPYEYDMSAAEIETYPPNAEGKDTPATLSIPIKEKQQQPM